MWRASVTWDEFERICGWPKYTKIRYCREVELERWGTWTRLTHWLWPFRFERFSFARLISANSSQVEWGPQTHTHTLTRKYGTDAQKSTNRINFSATWRPFLSLMYSVHYAMLAMSTRAFDVKENATYTCWTQSKWYGTRRRVWHCHRKCATEIRSEKIFRSIQPIVPI